MEYVRVLIRSMDNEGRGRSSYSDDFGNTFEVACRGGFIGDDLLVKIERVFKAHKLKIGRAVKYYHQGSFHLKRLCPYKGPCPACPLHGAKKELEDEIKIDRIKNALFRIGQEFAIDAIVQPRHPYGYRQKIKLIAKIIDGNLRLGVYVPYTHQFVLAEKCPLVRPEINEGIQKILEVLNGNAFDHDRTLFKAIIMRLGRSGLSAVLVVGAKLSKRGFKSLEAVVDNGTFLSMVERVQEQETNSVLAGEITRLIGPPLIEPLEGGPGVDPDSFCQTDPDLANFMYQVVADFLTQQGSNGIFVDAYAGTGGFSRALLQNGCPNIVAIEQSPKASSTLKKLAVTVISKPMSEALKDLVSFGPIAGMVVDPPKKGLAEDKNAILELNISRFALVSCDPDAMAQDVKVLIEHGYKLHRIIPIDFFGGTPNIETVVLLRGPLD